jgi:hypothetical protein
MLKKKRPNLCHKDFILQHFKHCPLQSSPLYWRYTVPNVSSIVGMLPGLIRRTACARSQFSGCSSTTNAYSETKQMAVSCQNLPLGALSSRSASSVLVGALFKKFGLFLNTGVDALCEELYVCIAGPHYCDCMCFPYGTIWGWRHNWHSK